MSYDMMVFEVGSAPRDPAGFIAWYDRQTQWNERHEYNDPAVSSPALQAWFAEMATVFPPLSYAVDDDPHATDYSIGQHVIYGAFASSVAEQAHGLMQDLAEKHGVGFFDVSAGDAAIVFPDGLVLIPD